MKKTGFYAGSFDPFTKGHLAIVCEALGSYEEVIIGIGVNPSKQAFFDVEQRKALILSSIDDFVQQYRYRELNGKIFSVQEAKAACLLLEHPEKIKVISYEDLTIDAAIRNGAEALIRGERIVGDHDAEMALAFVNRELLAIRKCHLDIHVIQLSEAKLTYVSSSAVKNLCAVGEYIAAMKYVMPSVHRAFMERYLYKHFNLEWDNIRSAYSSKKRAYHNFSHIGYCLNYVNIYKNIKAEDFAYASQNEKDALTAAIFYHDYFCFGKDNDEQESARAAKVLAQYGFDTSEIQQLIMMTKHTGKYIAAASPAQELIHDVDLAILGDRENYGRYAMQVRQEYAEYETSDYAKQRCKVLKKLLASDYLYLTEFFADAFLANAEINMLNELAYWESRQ